MKRKNLKTLFLLVCVCSLFLTKSHACTCVKIGKITTKSSYNSSKFVMHGLVLEIKEAEIQDTMLYNTLIEHGISSQNIPENFIKSPIKQITFKVIYNYKKFQIQDTISILTGFDGAACGVGFEINKEYLVFSSSNEPCIPPKTRHQIIWTDTCTETKLFSKKENKKLIRLKNRS